VHYFKHAIRNWKAMGHRIVVTCRNKEITYELLKLEGLDFIPMGKNPPSTFGKLFFLLQCEWKTFWIFVKHRPDIAISFAASYVAHISWLFGKPHLSFDDTEHASFNRRLYLPFTDLVLNPESYLLDFGKKQFKFKGHMELFYLNEKCFRPDVSIYSELGIPVNSPFILMRFVSWGAFHDRGQMGFSDEYKVEMVKQLSKIAPVFITSEGTLPNDLKPFQIRFKPHRIHHALHFASILITEGATMASECAALGTPCIYVNSLDAGTLQAQAADGLIFNWRYQEGVIEKALEILGDPYFKSNLRKRVSDLNQSRYNLTDWLTWLVAEYPKSKQLLIQGENPFEKG
jgi:predicted glycosyltransferase